MYLPPRSVSLGKHTPTTALQKLQGNKGSAFLHLCSCSQEQQEVFPTGPTLNLNRKLYFLFPFPPVAFGQSCICIVVACFVSGSLELQAEQLKCIHMKLVLPIPSPDPRAPQSVSFPVDSL